MIRVLIAAASAIVRAGLTALLRAEDFEVAGQAAAPDNLAALLSDTHIDVLVADLDEQGDDFPPQLSSLTGPVSPPLVLLLDTPVPDWTARSLRSGTRALLPREVTATELAGAVRAAAAGLVTVHPQFLDVLFAPSNLFGPNAFAPSVGARELPAGDLAQALSVREVEVLRMLADGLGNKIIAHRLGISDHTVKFHVASIMAKLNASSRTEAVTLGIRRGLIMI